MEEKQPSLLDKAISAGTAAVKFVAAGAPLTPNYELAKRLQTCSMCDKKTPGWNCSVCGCHIPIKARMATEKCPIDKWLPVVVAPLETKQVIVPGCNKCPKST